MRGFSRYFIRGVFTLLPMGLTVYVLVAFLRWTDRLSWEAFNLISPDLYFPGLGLLIGIALVCGLGYLTTKKFTDSVFGALELPFKNVPIISSIYTAVKSLADYFSSDGSGEEQQVVIVRPPDIEGLELVGLVTRSHLRDLPAQFSKGERISVFIPLSYQIGGLTVFIPRAWVQRVDMPVEAVMRSALTAWMPGREPER